MSKEKEAIGRLTDETWATENECGSVERTLEYQTSQGLKKVLVKAKVLSGSDTRTLEVKHTHEVDVGNLKLDTEGYIIDLIRTTYGLTEEQYTNICDNKPGDLISKMRTLAMELNGLAMEDQEIEKEKK